VGVGEKIKTKYWTLQHTWWAFLALKQTFAVSPTPCSAPYK